MSDFNLNFVEEFIDASRRCTNAVELRDGLMVHIAGLGFSHLAMYSVTERPSVTWVTQGHTGLPSRLGTYPDRWLDRYFECSYHEVDPVYMKMKTAASPVWWQDCNDRYERETGWSQTGRQFLDESGRIGLVRGLTIPIVSEAAVTGIAVCGEQARQGPEIGHLLHLVAIYFHQRLLEFGDVFHPEVQIRLTPREGEVLRWYARGKSAWDIGGVLSISEAAVRFHLSNVRGKYGVSSSVHATALAISRRDIQL